MNGSATLKVAGGSGETESSGLQAVGNGRANAEALGSVGLLRVVSAKTNINGNMQW